MALNKQDHADKPGYDVDLIEDVGFVRRNDRHAENLAEAGGENEKPDERPDERREEPLALMQKAQNLAPDDAAEAGEIAQRSEAARFFRYFRAGRGRGRAYYIDVHAASACVVPVMARKASLALAAPVAARKPGSVPVNSTRPLCRTMMLIGIRNLVDQMRGPEDAEAFGFHEPAHDGDDALARADVETDGRLVEQQQAGAMQHGAGDLDTPGLAAGQIAHLLVAAVSEAHERQCFASADLGLAAADAMQRGVVQQVLRQREIGIEGFGLEDDTEALQGRTRLAAHVVAQNVNLAGDVVVETGHEREQRRLAGAVEAQQNAEGSARHRHRHVVENAVVAEAVAYTVDDERVGGVLGLGRIDFVHLSIFFRMASRCF